MPWPGVRIAFVALNEREFKVVENPVDQVRSQVDQVVQEHVDPKVEASVAYLVLLFQSHKIRPEKIGNVGHPNEEGEENEKGEY